MDCSFLISLSIIVALLLRLDDVNEDGATLGGDPNENANEMEGCFGGYLLLITTSATLSSIDPSRFGRALSFLAVLSSI